MPIPHLSVVGVVRNDLLSALRFLVARQVKLVQLSRSNDENPRLTIGKAEDDKTIAVQVSVRSIGEQETPTGYRLEPQFLLSLLEYMPEGQDVAIDISPTAIAIASEYNTPPPVGEEGNIPRLLGLQVTALGLEPVDLSPEQ